MRVSHEGAVDSGVTSAISDAMSSLLSRRTGRGATSSWTTFSRDLIVCVMGNALTNGEKSLVQFGRPEAVLSIRKAYQESMAQEAIGIVEELSGRRVAAFMSNNHIDPDSPSRSSFCSQRLTAASGKRPNPTRTTSADRWRDAVGARFGPRRRSPCVRGPHPTA